MLTRPLRAGFGDMISHVVFPHTLCVVAFVAVCIPFTVIDLAWLKVRCDVM